MARYDRAANARARALFLVRLAVFVLFIFALSLAGSPQ